MKRAPTDPVLAEVVNALQAAEPSPCSPEVSCALIRKALHALEQQERQALRDEAARERMCGRRIERSWTIPRAHARLAWLGASALGALLAAATLTFVPSSNTSSQGPSPVGVLREVPASPRATEPSPARNAVNAPRPHQTILSEEDGEVVLISNGSLTLAAQTRLHLEESVDGVLLELLEGAVVLDIDPRAQERPVVINVGAERVIVEGTVLSVEAHPAGSSRVEVYEGRVRVESGAQNIQLTTGEIFATGTLPPTLSPVLRQVAQDLALARTSIEEKASAQARPDTGAYLIEGARTALREGKFLEALERSQKQLARRTDPAWLLLAGDSARAARKEALAIDYYRALSHSSLAGQADRIQGAYLAARLEGQRGNTSEALALLRDAGATERDSPLAEPALLLAVTLLHLDGASAQLQKTCAQLAASFARALPPECAAARQPRSTEAP